MSDIKDTIHRIDVPVTPVATTPDPNPVTEMPVRRWTSKAFLAPAIYGVLGLVVFGYTALVAYANVYQFVVETAVVGGRVDVVKAQTDGRIVYENLAAGQQVKKGTVIGRLKDPALEAEIERAEIQTRRHKAELAYLTRSSKNASNKMTEYAFLQKETITQLQDEAKALGKQLKHAVSKHKRLTRAGRRGYATNRAIDAAREYKMRVASRLRKVRAQLHKARSFAKRNKAQRYFNGKEIIDNVAEVEARMAHLKRKIALSHAEYLVLVKQRQERAIRAPFDARIVDLPKFSNTTVGRGDVLAILEPAGPVRVVAYLTQEEILKVTIGDKASVVVPALGRNMRARVKSINRTSGLVDAKSARFTWRPSEERNAEVLLEVTGIDAKTAAQLRAGLPAMVMLRDNGSESFLSSVWAGLFPASLSPGKA